MLSHPKKGRRNTMSVNPVLLVIWAVLAASFLALLIYRGQLTRYEDEQLFLNEEVDVNAQREQSEIVRKVHKLDPIVRTIGGAATVVTAGVVGLYVWSALKTLQ
jgi:hypothetical protein